MIEHLDRIEKLGFNPQLNWNKSFEISYDVQEYDNSINTFPFDIKILFCNYHISENVTYEEVIENSCDFFYSWYNKNLEIIKDFEIDSKSDNLDKLQDSILGDITSRVYRDLNLDNLLY
jgi:predicted metal-dependent peptidase